MNTAIALKETLKTAENRKDYRLLRERSTIPHETQHLDI